jgi:hypothetical protein
MDTAADSNYEGVFHFRLSEECNFIDIKELSGIELEIKDKEAEIKSVVSFKVRLKEADTEEEALEIAKSQAKRLVDILAISAVKHLGYFLTGSQTTHKPAGKSTVSATLLSKFDQDSGKPLDLRKTRIAKAIKTHEPKDRDLTFVQSLGYANESLGAHTNNLYQVMIKQFYLALGDRPEARKYNHLRDALSHHEELATRGTRQCVENDFPGKFEWTTNNTLDYSSDKTIQSLREVAME